MSDQPSAPPPPPPESNPAPYSPPPPLTAGYQPPPGTYQPPGSTPPSVLPTRMGPAGAAGIMSQFTGNAGWASLVGIICIAVPFIFNRVFFFLPIIGLILAITAIVRSKQMIGGIVAIVLNVIGGIITVIALLPSSGG